MPETGDGCRDDPVILLGRGGSGTRILSELARSSGVFIGNEVNHTGDSVEWVQPIYDLAVTAVSAGGQTTAEATTAPSCATLRRHAAAILRTGRLPPEAPWGWKLPETMLILAHALHAFPSARVIHLVRHPVPSAVRRTHMTSRLDNPVGQAALAAAYRAHGLEREQIESDPPYIHNAISWNHQLRSALAALDEAPSSVRVLQLRYESFISDPAAAAASFTGFLGLHDPDPAQLPPVQPDRSRPQYEVDRDAVARIWAICGETASRLGYAFEPPAAIGADGSLSASA